MDVNTAFSQIAVDYDRPRRQLVPDFDNFYGMALTVIPFANDAELRVLDLGAGTGLFAALFGAAFPNARLTLADFSPQMLDQARARFAGRMNVTYLTLDYERDSIPGEYDVVISALALHHTPQPNLLRRFREDLRGVSQRWHLRQRRSDVRDERRKRGALCSGVSGISQGTGEQRSRHRWRAGAVQAGQVGDARKSNGVAAAGGLHAGRLLVQALPLRRLFRSQVLDVLDETEANRGVIRFRVEFVVKINQRAPV